MKSDKHVNNIYMILLSIGKTSTLCGAILCGLLLTFSLLILFNLELSEKDLLIALTISIVLFLLCLLFIYFYIKIKKALEKELLNNSHNYTEKK